MASLLAHARLTARWVSVAPGGEPRSYGLRAVPGWRSARRSLSRAGQRRRQLTRPSSTRRRRSIRCPTWASNGPTSTSPNRPRHPKSRAWRRRQRPRRPRRQPSGSRMPPRRDAIAGRSPGWKDCRSRPRCSSGFDERSALEGDSKKTANAAQIDRRARADAELLAELLRSQGYYDATVEPRIEAAGDELVGQLRRDPGPALPLRKRRAAGARGSRRRRSGSSCARRSRSRPATRSSPQKVIAAGVALQVALGERGFATAKVGEQDIVVDHETQTARLVLPVTPGPVARIRRRSASAASRRSRRRHVGAIARFKPGDRFERERGRRPAPGADRDRADLVGRGHAGAARRRAGRSTSRSSSSRRRCGPSPASLATAPARAAGRGELAAPQFLQPRRRADRARRRRHAGAAWRGLAPPQQLAAARPGAERPGARPATSTATPIEAKTLSLSAGFERQSNFIWQKKWTWSLGAELIATDERDTIESTGEPRRRTFFIAALPGEPRL